MTNPARSAIFSLMGDLDPPSLGVTDPTAPSLYNSSMPALSSIDNAAPGLLRTTTGDRKCFVHKITSAGASLTISGHVGHGERATMELPFGLAADGAIEGHDPAAVAFRFDTPVDVVGALARCLAALPAERRRMPRIELRQRMLVRHADQVDFAWTRNLSPRGVGLEMRAHLAPGDPVEITLDGLRPIPGEIRWAERGHAGIAFADELGWQVLMPWLRKIASQPRIVTAASDIAPSAMGAVKDVLRLDIATHIRSGVSWWNAQLSAISSALVEFESATDFAPRASLWLSLPEIGGWPIRVIESHGVRHVAEFRLPLRPHEMARLTEAVRGR